MSLELSRIRALCFDVDGTLSDTDDLYAQQVTRFLPRSLFRDPDLLARPFVLWIEAPRNALLGTPDRLGLDDELVALANWLNLHRRRTMRSFLLIPGVDTMLARLHGRFPMAVVSARDEGTTRAFLDHFNLTRYLDVIVSAFSAPHTKPYPDPVIYAPQ